MDPITHSLVGGLSAKTVGTTKRRFWIMMFLGEAPDLDVLFNGFGGWAFWLQHRGITHSLVGVALQALFYAWVFARWDEGIFRRRVMHYSIPLAFHLVCDYLTSYGVPLLSPFSFMDFSADLMPSVAIIPLVVMAFGISWMHRRDRSGWHATRPLWFLWGAYLMFAVSGKASATNIVWPVTRQEVRTLPHIANPFSWSALWCDDKSHTYRQYNVDVMKGERKEGAVVAMPDEAFPVLASRKSATVQEFLKSTQWPVVRVTPTEKGWLVEWGNLLFSSRGLVRGKIGLEIARDGEITSEQKIFSFWSPSKPS